MDKFTLSITITVNKGYDSVVSETIKAPADTDITLLGQTVERRINEALQTTRDFYPESRGSVESETSIK